VGAPNPARAASATSSRGATLAPCRDVQTNVEPRAERPIRVTLVVTVLWYLSPHALLDPQRRFLLPAPHEILTDAHFQPDALGDILTTPRHTTALALVDSVIAIARGVLWAVAMSQARWLDRSLFPYAVILQCFSGLAPVPLIGFRLGHDRPTRVVVRVLIALLPGLASWAARTAADTSVTH
jgi:NitT/TauT family transport system permease protein